MNSRKMMIIKKIVLVIFVRILASFVLIGCGTSQSQLEAVDEVEELTVIGFSQLGAESDWRNANTQSMRETFTEKDGYKLIIDDAQQKQSNQITAIRTFIQQDVDYIVLAPVMEDGWDTVLTEAKEAGIPVIIVDRMVNVEDNDLFTCWVGSDFKLEGLKICDYIRQCMIKKGIKASDVNIVDIQGTLGSSAQIGRTRGLEESCRKYGWNLIAQESGEYTQAKGREVMKQLLSRHKDINIAYCENDNEAFGVIEAIEASGRHVGNDIKNGDIMVVSFDGVSDEAIADVKSGKISCIGECNPHHGPRVKTIIESLKRGETPEKYEYVRESIFSNMEDITSVDVDGNTYAVTVLSK